MSFRCSANSALYALEAGYVLTLSLAMTEVRAFPNWFRTFGIVVGLMQAINGAALWLGFPDAATIPGNVGMVGWILVASLLLLKAARLAKSAIPTAARPAQARQ